MGLVVATARTRDLTDLGLQMRGRGEELLELSGPEMQQVTGRDRAHGVRALAAVQQRHLAEEGTALQSHGVAGDLDYQLAGDHEVHAVGLVALAEDGGAGFEPHRLEDQGDAGDPRRAQMAEQRHPRDQLPGDDEVAPPKLLDES